MYGSTHLNTYIKGYKMKNYKDFKYKVIKIIVEYKMF